VLSQVCKLNDSISEGRYRELLELLGLDGAEKSQDEEVRTVEGVLLADTTGNMDVGKDSCKKHTQPMEDAGKDRKTRREAGRYCGTDLLSRT
jgi:hypothetical protein